MVPTPKISKLLSRDGPDAFVRITNYGYWPQSGPSHGKFNGTASDGFYPINANTRGNTGLPSQPIPNPGVTSSPNRLRLPSALTPILHTSVSVTIRWARSPGMSVLGTMEDFYVDQMSNYQIKTPFYRAHNPAVPRSDSQINSVLLPPFRFLSMPPALLLVPPSR